MTPELRKPRLLVVASTFPARAGDGTPSFVRDLAVGVSRDFDVQVLVPAVPGAPSRESGDGITVVRYRYFPRRWEDLAHGAILENVRSRKSRLIQVPFFLIAQAFAVRKAVRKHRPDVIHAHWIIPQGIVARLVAPHVPTVVTTLGGDLYALGDPVSRRLKRAVLTRAKAVTVMNADMRTRAIDLGASPATTQVMPMGAQVAQFADAAAGRSTTPSDAKAPVRLLAVGRLVEKKGFHLLLEALAGIDHHSWRLTIVGDGPQRVALEAAATGLPVDFAGQLSREDLAQADAEADVAVFPSVRAKSGDQDGLPVALLEAMASGCAVIVSDLPGLDEAVDAEVTGLCVPNGDVDALRQALGLLIRDPALRGTLGRAAAMRAQDFDVASVAQAYARVLSEAAQGSAQRN